MRVAGRARGAGAESRGVLECAQASRVGGAGAAAARTHTAARAALCPHCKQTYSHLSASRQRMITIFSTNKLTYTVT